MKFVNDSMPKARALGSRRRRSTRQLLLAVGFTTVLVLLPVAASARTASSAKTTTITVKIRDATFALSSKKVAAGKVVFAVQNLGKAIHNFSVAGKKTPALKHGKKARLIVTFTKVGKYTYRSTIKGDSKRLKGVLTVTPRPKPSVAGNVAAGKVAFKANCATCHTLKEAGTVGQIGPNLDNLKLAYATIVKTVTSGKTGSQGTMPSFGGTLTAAQIADLAAFVYTAEQS